MSPDRITRRVPDRPGGIPVETELLRKYYSCSQHGPVEVTGRNITELNANFTVEAAYHANCNPLGQIH